MCKYSQIFANLYLKLRTWFGKTDTFLYSPQKIDQNCDYIYPNSITNLRIYIDNLRNYLEVCTPLHDLPVAIISPVTILQNYHLSGRDDAGSSIPPSLHCCHHLHTSATSCPPLVAAGTADHLFKMAACRAAGEAESRSRGACLPAPN